jgi:hypothetical protein
LAVFVLNCLCSNQSEANVIIGKLQICRFRLRLQAPKSDGIMPCACIIAVVCLLTLFVTNGLLVLAHIEYLNHRNGRYK